MRTAYQVLGIPGNASQQDIEEAFARSQQFFTRERLAETEGAVAQFTQVKEAYQVLRDPETRAAHDRKLAAAAAAPPAAARPRTKAMAPPPAQPFPWVQAGVVALVALLIIVFGTGYYLNARNAENRRIQEAHERSARAEAELEAQRKAQDEARLDAQRARDKARAESADRMLSMQAQSVAAGVAAQTRREEAAAAVAQRQNSYDAQRAEAQRQADDRRSAMEAQRRIQEDKRRVRELCMLNYRRPDC